MKATCPNCGHEFSAPHPHLTEEGFVTVRLHRRKKHSFYFRREDFDDVVADAIDNYRHENEHLRRKVMELTRRDSTSNHIPEGSDR